MQTLDALLAPERLNRLEGQHRPMPSVPAPAQLFDLLLDRTLAQSGTEVGRRIATMTRPRARPRAARRRRCRRPSRCSLPAGSTGSPTSSTRERGPAAEQDWAHGLAALLKDREALDKALADPARLPRVPPGMPIGMDDDL